MRRNRREFLKGAAALTATVAAPAAAAANALPTIRLGKHQITRLILGANPIYGYSHFNRLYDQHMRDYHTPERVVELLKSAEANGINTWQSSYDERMVSDLGRFREQGGKLNWICVCRPTFLDDPALIAAALKHKPIAIVQHGGITDRVFRAGEFQKSRDLLQRVRQAGVLVGVACHNPAAAIDRMESEGWDIDFYMACFYYVSRPKDELQKMLGELPLGEPYLSGDTARATAAMRKCKKPCLGYKILAAGRASDTPAQRRAAFEYAYRNIKPADGVIVGMWNRFSEQVAENAALARTLLV
jgi:hypothetical protein